MAGAGKLQHYVRLTLGRVLWACSRQHIDSGDHRLPSKEGGRQSFESAGSRVLREGIMVGYHVMDRPIGWKNREAFSPRRIFLLSLGQGAVRLSQAMEQQTCGSWFILHKK